MIDRQAARGFSAGFFGCFGALAALAICIVVVVVLAHLTQRQTVRPTNAVIPHTGVTHCATAIGLYPELDGRDDVAVSDATSRQGSDLITCEFRVGQSFTLLTVRRLCEDGFDARCVEPARQAAQ